MKDLIKSITYHFINILYKFYLKICRIEIEYIGDDFLKNKRIIVIGPAESSMTYMSGKDIDSFDVIVRINKSPLSLKNKEHILGSRTDILYHCCDEDPITGGGLLNNMLLKEQKNKTVIFTYADKKLFKNFYKLMLKYPDIQFKKTHKSLYENIVKQYSGKLPTTGFQALNHLLTLEFKELHITGFTFFKTAYADGYKDNYNSASQAQALATSSGNHNPNDELRLFKKMLSQNPRKNLIRTDLTLEKILKEE